MKQNFANPFEVFDSRLSEIQSMLIEIRHKKEVPNIGTESKPDRYITTKEVAEIYGVSEVSVWDWEQKGFIIGYRIGNTKRYKLSEILTAPKLIIRKKK